MKGMLLMQSTKILHANDDNHNLGGAFLITYRVEKYLRKYGYSYDYLSMDHFDKESRYPISEDDKTYSANLRKNRLLGHILLPFYVNKVLKDCSYDIMHIDTDSAWKALLYAVPAKKNGVKTVIHSHAMDIEGDAKRLKSWAEMISKRILTRYADKYIACSQNAAKWIVPPTTNQTPEVIINGIELDEFCFLKEERTEYRKQLNLGDSIVLGNVGLFSENKNQKYLVDLLDKLVKKNYDVKLLLVGKDDTAYGKEVKKLVENKRLNKRVVFAGERSDVRQLLNAMDIYIQPSYREGFGLSTVEAQATGLKTCISDKLPKECCACEWAFMFALKTGDDQIEQVVSDYIYNENERESRRLNKKYSIEYMARSEAHVYGTLIDKRMQ